MPEPNVIRSTILREKLVLLNLSHDCLAARPRFLLSISNFHRASPFLDSFRPSLLLFCLLFLFCIIHLLPLQVMAIRPVSLLPGFNKAV